MGFCTEEEYTEFMRSCPEFERMLVRSGIILLKYWFSVADDKRRARLNCISHILSSVPYQDVVPPAIHLPHRRHPDDSYVRPPKEEQNFVPDVKFPAITRT
jgi:hypothetical protein